MAKKKPDEIVYETWILRRDQQHIAVVVSTDFEKCYKVWEELQAQWAECAKEVKPFVLKDPVLTAFEPGLIYEITLRPVESPVSNAVNSKNPYAREMLNRGFSDVFGNQDLLSRANTDY